MRNVASLPAKSPTYTCTDCGIPAATPIVVGLGDASHPERGRCSNRKACELRQLRAANRAKAAKS